MRRSRKLLDEHMAQQLALADAEVAPGARATMRW